MAWRFPLAARLTIILTGVAVLALASAAFLQDRALSKGLHAAAAARLDRSARITEQLASDYLHDLVVRFVAVSQTPELRATLELRHAPTLERLTRSLVRQFRVTRVELADAEWRVLAQSNAEKQSGSPLAAWRSLRAVNVGAPVCVGLDDDRSTFAPCSLGRDLRPQATIQRLGGVPQALVLIPLSTGGRHVGILFLSAPLAISVLDGWSDLVGARVEAVDPSVDAAEPLKRVAHAFPHLELRVSSSLEPELATQAETRRIGVLAGVVAIVIALSISALSARDFLRPIREIGWATEQLGRGDLDVRLRSTRTDEIGDVARVLDHTLDRLSSSQQRLRNVQRIAQFGDWSADLESEVVEGSREFENVLGLCFEEKRTLADLLRCFVGADREKLEKGLDQCAREGTPIELDLRVAVESAERIIHVRARHVVDGDRASRIEGSVQDVTDRRRAEEQIRFLAYHDSLTGLPNRRFMNERLALALAPVNHQSFSLLFLDLDRFKLVNDTLGHSAGDELVRIVADRLTRIVGRDPGAAVARFGGDEFALLLPGLVEEPELVEMVSDLIRAVSSPIELRGHQMSITASVGIARSPTDGRTIEALLRSCDTALHCAKENGRNCFCLYDGTMEEVANQRWQLENRLRRAAEAMAFEIYYQPRVSADDSALAGFEALLRWKDPDFGGYTPAEFIPIAEETGLIVSIGAWVLRTVVHQLRSWIGEGVSIVPVSVNVSGRQLTRDLAASVRSLLREAEVDPSLLEIEVTESAVIADAEAGVAALEELRSLGVRISLDDFGTGYSSLSYLRSLPISSLKIDRSFSNSLGDDGRDTELVASIVSMAQVLGLSVIAEGVETEEQAELLREMGCDELQGFLFGEPMPSANARLLLAEKASLAPAKQKTRRTRAD